MRELRAVDIPWNRQTALIDTPSAPPPHGTELRLVDERAERDEKQSAALPADLEEIAFDDLSESASPTPSETTPPPALRETGQVRRQRERHEAKLARTTERQTPFALSDSGNAEHFEQMGNGGLAFDHTARLWFVFNGHHWQVDSVKRVLERALHSVREQQRAAALIADSDLRKATLRWTLKSEDHRHLVDLLTLASAKPSIAVDGKNWNQDPMLFGVTNGAVDLETGTFRPGQPEDYITKISPVVYDAAATCPRFVRFMQELFADHSELIDYLQRVFGYCLTGLTVEQMFWICWGLGGNGKTTLLELFQDSIFGAYAWTMPFPVATWTTAMSEYQRAELPGRRVVTASEVKRRGHLHEDFIKSLTGGDSVNARQIYGRPFTFIPCAKFLLRCNERPIIKDLTHSMWRRVKVIPFTRTFPQDITLSAALTAEASGIFNWLLEGLRLWRTEGFREPAIVQTETDAYRADSDVLTEFLADRCLIGDGLSIGGREIFTAYVAWEDLQRTPPDDRLSQKTFGLRMKERFPDIGKRTVRYSGVTLIGTDEHERSDEK